MAASKLPSEGVFVGDGARDEAHEPDLGVLAGRLVLILKSDRVGVLGAGLAGRGEGAREGLHTKVNPLMYIHTYGSETIILSTSLHQ